MNTMIVYAPFWPSVAALIIIVAAIFAGIIDASRNADGRPTTEWLWRATFMYGLPVLCLAAPLATWLYRINGEQRVGAYFSQPCHTDVCRPAVQAVLAALTDNFLLQLAGITAVCLVVITGILLFRIRPRRTRSQGTPNPRKWFLDQDTGEYHKVVSFHGDRVRFEKDDFSARNLERERRRDAVRKEWQRIPIGLFVIC